MLNQYTNNRQDGNKGFTKPTHKKFVPKNHNSTQKEPNLNLMLTAQPRKMRFQTTATNSSIGVINNSLTGEFY